MQRANKSMEATHKLAPHLNVRCRDIRRRCKVKKQKRSGSGQYMLRILTCVILSVSLLPTSLFAADVGDTEIFLRLFTDQLFYKASKEVAFWGKIRAGNSKYIQKNQVVHLKHSRLIIYDAKTGKELQTIKPAMYIPPPEKSHGEIRVGASQLNNSKGYLNVLENGQYKAKWIVDEYESNEVTFEINPSPDLANVQPVTIEPIDSGMGHAFAAHFFYRYMNKTEEIVKFNKNMIDSKVLIDGKEHPINPKWADSWVVDKELQPYESISGFISLGKYLPSDSISEEKHIVTVEIMGVRSSRVEIDWIHRE